MKQLILRMVLAVGSVDTRKAVFDFKCSGPNVERCSSYRVGGWISR